MPFDQLISNTRLLTSWCWREKHLPAFPASAATTDAGAGLRQELWLGFDVDEGSEHSVLSMVVHKKWEGAEPAWGWSVDLQVHGQSFPVPESAGGCECDATKTVSSACCNSQENYVVVHCILIRRCVSAC